MALSEFELHQIFNTARGTPKPAWTPYLGLSIGDPYTGGLEVTGGSYGRQIVVFDLPAGRIMVNSNRVTFPQPTGSWGGAPITHAVLWDALSGGTARHAFPLAGSDEQRTIGIGSSPPDFGPGTISMSGP